MTWNVNGTKLDTPALVAQVYDVIARLMQRVDRTAGTCVIIGLQEVIPVNTLLNREGLSEKMRLAWKKVLTEAITNVVPANSIVKSVGSHAQECGLAVHVFSITAMQVNNGYEWLDYPDIYVGKHGMAKGSMTMSIGTNNGYTVTVVVTHLTAYARTALFQQDKSAKGKAKSLESRNSTINVDVNNILKCNNDHKRIILMGDLNYRCVDTVNPTNDVQAMFPSPPDVWSESLSKIFTRYDELNKCRSTILPLFTESSVQFPPTYKLGTTTGKRQYAWTDRILHTSSTLMAVPITYTSIPPTAAINLLSDHAPVTQDFTMQANWAPVFIKAHVTCGDCGKLRHVHTHEVNMPLCLALYNKMEHPVVMQQLQPVARVQAGNKRIVAEKAGVAAAAKKAAKERQAAQIAKSVEKTPDEKENDQAEVELLKRSYPNFREVMYIENSQHAIALLIELRQEIVTLFTGVLSLPDNAALTGFADQFAKFAIAMVTKIAGPVVGVVMDKIQQKEFRVLLDRIVDQEALFITTVCQKRVPNVNIQGIIEAIGDVISAMDVGNVRYRRDSRGPILTLLAESFSDINKYYLETYMRLMLVAKAYAYVK